MARGERLAELEERVGRLRERLGEGNQTDCPVAGPSGHTLRACGRATLRVRLLLLADGRALVHEPKGTRLPLDFLKRRPTEKASVQAAPSLLPEDVEAEDHTLKLTYRAKTSQGVRMAAGTTSPCTSCR